MEEESDKAGAKVGGGGDSQAVPQVISLVGAVDSRWLCDERGNGAWLMVASLHVGGAKSQRQTKNWAQAVYATDVEVIERGRFGMYCLYDYTFETAGSCYVRWGCCWS